MNAPARRIAVFDTVVRQVIRETQDTVTLVLDPGDHPRDYDAGQFVSIDPRQFRALHQQIDHLERLKDRKEQVRAYSLASAPHEPHLLVTVKEEPFTGAYPCLLSPFLVYGGVRAGDRITVKGYSGMYTLPAELDDLTDTVLHVVAGSGVVPNFGMIKDSLRRHRRVKHVLVDSNRTVGDIIFHNELEALARAHPDRLRVLHCLTRQDDVPDGMRRGRVCRPLLEEAIADPATVRVYGCGPAITKWERKAAKARGEEPAPRFIETVQALLQELGVPRAHVQVEAFG